LAEPFTAQWVDDLNQQFGGVVLSPNDEVGQLEIAYQIQDEKSEILYHVVLNKSVKFIWGPPNTACPTIITDKKTALELYSGKLSIAEAISEGKIKIRGDLQKLVNGQQVLQLAREELLKAKQSFSFSEEVDNPMEILSSRILLRPTNMERSLNFYGNDLGLAVYREFGVGNERGIVFFLGGGFLELSGRSGTPAGPNVSLWLQVRDVEAAYRHLVSKGVLISKKPKLEPWGLKEMWVNDPDGVRLYIVEVPEDHPLRKRVE
jgi:predicted enzyme related to lactoylglutathione lyase